MLPLLLPCLLVGAVWGSTNALMRKFAAESVSTPSSARARGRTVARKAPSNPGADLAAASKSPKWVAAFALNQLGSALFYVTLGSAELTTAVPLVQGTTMVATAVTAAVLGEAKPTPLVALGVLLVTTGLMLMLSSPS